MDIVVVDPADAGAQEALAAYLDDIRHLAGVEIDVTGALADVADYRPPTGRFWVVWSDELALGCAGLRTLFPGTGELKRMWISNHLRGSGLASLLLAEVERGARDMELRRLVLDTNGGLEAALRFYERHGYSPIARYNDNAEATHFFGKDLTRVT